MISGKHISKIWFDNIKKLDDINHLKHGEIYARDGSLFDLKINNSTVTAKVENTPGEIVHVKITFKEMTNNNKKYLKNYIMDNPFMISLIISNSCPKDLLDTKVRIFPKTLKDFKMECDCKIEKLFCKHKAAVFHKLKMEIEKNPLLIFTLRGFDVKKAIGGDNNIKTFQELLDDVSKYDYNESLKNKGYDNFSLLEDYPSFYPSYSVDFKDILKSTIKSMSESMGEIQSKSSKKLIEYISLDDKKHKSFQAKWLKPKTWDTFTVDINEEYEINKIFTSKNKLLKHSNMKKLLFAFCEESNQINLNNHNQNIILLNDVYNFTTDLINICGLIPELYAITDNKYHIRWIPTINNLVIEKLEKLTNSCVHDIITVNDKKLSFKNQIIILISLIFEGFCQYYNENLIPYTLKPYSNEKFYKLFFKESQFFTDDSIEDVNDWLKPLYEVEEKYEFVLDITQENLKFKLDFKIKTNSQNITFKEAFESTNYQIVKNAISIESILSEINGNINLNQEILLDIDEFDKFMENQFYDLKFNNVEINLPEELEENVKTRLYLKLDDSKIKDNSLTLNNLDKFNWRVAIGDEKISLEEFKKISLKYTGLIKLNNKYYKIDELELYELEMMVDNLPKTKEDLIQFILTQDYSDIDIDEKITNLLTGPGSEEIEVPESLNASLRPYQKTGFSWLVQNLKYGFGSILADDMGLGKTIQALTAILYLKENDYLNNGKILIVVPTSILTNWQKEIEKFTPTLKSIIYHGIDRYLIDEDYDIMLTSYGVLRSDIDDFINKNWSMMVIDEAQNIKNPKSKQTLAVKSVNADYYVALSGTPVENRLAEYWSIFDFTNKGYLKTLTSFKKNYINPIEKHHDMDVLDNFKSITKPFILRRLKSDRNIIHDLPDKIINDVYCNLTVKQAAMYNETLEVLIRDVESGEGMQRKGLILKLITSLKQICNHPANFSKSDKFNIAESGKMDVVINLIENIVENDEKVLIFTQYVKMGEIMKELMEDHFNEEVLFLHGAVDRSRRDKMVDEFQNGKPHIFILSLKAGGLGLNLTAATNVIHYDLWWNPAVENQATDRAYRIGQTDNVMVYRFITTGTFEEHINKILIDKRELAEMTIDGSETFITEMSDDELKLMLELR